MRLLTPPAFRLPARPRAVQVRHPGCARAIWQDFQLLRPLAALTARVRSLRVRPELAQGRVVSSPACRLLLLLPRARAARAPCCTPAPR